MKIRSAHRDVGREFPYPRHREDPISLGGMRLPGQCDSPSASLGQHLLDQAVEQRCSGRGIVHRY